MKNSKIINDIILVCGILLVSAIAFSFLKFNKKSGDSVVITVDGEILYEFSLYDDSEKLIITENGTNEIVIKNGTVYFKGADCPDKICVEHIPISKVGETIVCLPHKLVAEIKGAE